jgi:hypothetical protein
LLRCRSNPPGTEPTSSSLLVTVLPAYDGHDTAADPPPLCLSPTGTFTIWNAYGTADVIIDVMGSYGPLSSYTYNGDGLRATRTTTTGTQNFAWDPTGSVPLMLTDGTISYIYDNNGNPLEQIRDACEGAAADHLAGDDLEEALDEVQPGGFPTSASRRCSPEPSPSEARSEALRLKVLARSATRLSSLPARVGRCGLSGAEASASR